MKRVLCSIVSILEGSEPLGKGYSGAIRSGGTLRRNKNLSCRTGNWGGYEPLGLKDESNKGGGADVEALIVPDRKGGVLTVAGVGGKKAAEESMKMNWLQRGGGIRMTFFFGWLITLVGLGWGLRKDDGFRWEMEPKGDPLFLRSER